MGVYRNQTNYSGFKRSEFSAFTVLISFDDYYCLIDIGVIELDLATLTV